MTWDETKALIHKISAFELALGCAKQPEVYRPQRWYNPPKYRCFCEKVHALTEEFLDQKHTAACSDKGDLVITFPEDQSGPLDHRLFSAGSVWSTIPRFSFADPGTVWGADNGFHPAHSVSEVLTKHFIERAARILYVQPEVTIGRIIQEANQHFLASVLLGRIVFDPWNNQWVDAWLSPSAFKKPLKQTPSPVLSYPLQEAHAINVLTELKKSIQAMNPVYAKLFTTKIV